MKMLCMRELILLIENHLYDPIKQFFDLCSYLITLNCEDSDIDILNSDTALSVHLV